MVYVPETSRRRVLEPISDVPILGAIVAHVAPHAVVAIASFRKSRAGVGPRLASLVGFTTTAPVIDGEELKKEGR